MIILTRENVNVLEGEWVYLEFSAIAGTYTITINGTFDSDLYTSITSRVTADNFDCRPYDSTGENDISYETCEVILAENGTIYVGVNAYETCVFTITVDGPDQILNVITDMDEGNPLDRSCDCVVDWGDGTSNHFTIYTDSAWKHVYATAGNYDITITGRCNAPDFLGIGDDCDKVIDIKQWGSLQGAIDWNGAFYSCYNLECSAVDVFGTGVVNLDSTFAFCEKFNGVVNQWDISSVTTLNNTFYQCNVFNSPIDNWNTSNVSNMYGVFENCLTFNRSVNNWNISNVTTIAQMFANCMVFDQPLNNWNTANVVNMDSVLFGCNSFNQPVNNWVTSKVTNMHDSFNGCDLFNHPLNNWNMSNVTDISGMFSSCDLFNQPLDNWNVSNVTTIRTLFWSCSSFNQSLNTWNTSKVTDMYSVFGNCTSFNQPLNNWNTSNVTEMKFMFTNGTSFNQDLSCWNVANILTIPLDFKFNCPLTPENMPQWGVVDPCPEGPQPFECPNGSVWETFKVVTL